MAKQTNQMLYGFLAAAILIVGVLFFTGNIDPTGMQIKDAEKEDLDKEAVEVQVSCGTDSLGEIRLAASNPLNTSATEYIATTARMYQPDGSYTGDISLVATGLPAEGSGTACSECGQDYTYVVEASDASHISATGSVLCKDGGMEIFKLPQHAALLFKVRNEELVSFVYPSAESSANTMVSTGTTFYSTTSNATGVTIGADGNYNYMIWVQINKTAATDTQFTDQGLIIAQNANLLADWDVPSITPQGAGQSATLLSSCPGKIGNDGYDWCWELTENGEPLVISGDFVKIDVQQQALGGVNPDDDLTFGFFTSGYYKHTLDEGVSVGYNKDDPAKTDVYTEQTLILSIV